LLGLDWAWALAAAIAAWVYQLVFATRDLPLGFGIAFVRLQRRILVYGLVLDARSDRYFVMRSQTGFEIGF
jgi:hypothetical protein